MQRSARPRHGCARRARRHKRTNVWHCLEVARAPAPKVWCNGGREQRRPCALPSLWRHDSSDRESLQTLQARPGADARRRAPPAPPGRARPQLPTCSRGRSPANARAVRAAVPIELSIIDVVAPLALRRRRHRPDGHWRLHRDPARAGAKAPAADQRQTVHRSERRARPDARARIAATDGPAAIRDSAGGAAVRGDFRRGNVWRAIGGVDVRALEAMWPRRSAAQRHVHGPGAAACGSGGGRPCESGRVPLRRRRGRSLSAGDWLPVLRPAER